MANTSPSLISTSFNEELMQFFDNLDFSRPQSFVSTKSASKDPSTDAPAEDDQTDSESQLKEFEPIDLDQWFQMVSDTFSVKDLQLSPDISTEHVSPYHLMEILAMEFCQIPVQFIAHNCSNNRKSMLLPKIESRH